MGRGYSKGQMTVEFMVAFPCMIIIALIATNALLFFSECASFDRVFRQSVCTYAVSPGYGEDAAGAIESNLANALDPSLTEVEVSGSSQGSGLSTYTATLRFQPTLFGQGSISSVFGVSLSPLTHTSTFTVDAYKPGVLL